jgi:hypothetical protein
MKYSKIMAAVLAVLLTIGCFSGCGLLGTGQSTSSKNTAVQTTVQLTSSDGKYSLEIPDKWKDMQAALSSDSVLACGNNAKEQYLIIIPDSKSELSMNFSEYTSVILHQIGTNMENAVIDQTADFEIPGHAATRTTVSGTADGLKVRYWVYTVDCPEDYLQIVAWTLQDKAEETEQTYDQVAQSLKEAAGTQ